MGTFSIEFTDPGAPRDPAMASGLIRLGDDTEYFGAPIGYWSVDDYQAGWAAALRRTLDGETVACLPVTMSDPKTTNFVEVWALYRDGDVVHVQNQLIFLADLDHDFDPAEPWRSVDPRATVTEDGDAISEWTVQVTAIEEFVDSGAGR
ncbi:hypothetical protein [Nocardia tengchongensis]|uniref:hypothetical protein n=1 Tax=Nocardia tengchongensis TaxID=2055889 RepID=UPI00368ACE1B